jgi:hypothetical protein
MRCSSDVLGRGVGWRIVYRGTRMELWRFSFEALVFCLRCCIFFTKHTTEKAWKRGKWGGKEVWFTSCIYV